MSVVSRVGLLRRGFILAVWKDAGTTPQQVREELIRAVRNGRRSMRWPGGERKG